MDGRNHVLLPRGGKTQTDVHGTPRDLFAALNAEFGPFDLDPASDGDNALCSRYFTPKENGLLQDWGSGRVFLNPPYSDMLAWMRKAHEASERALVVCLVPVRTDTAWWHDYAMKGEVRFIRGRLRFGSAKTNAPFPSAIVIFYPPWFGID